MNKQKSNPFKFGDPVAGEFYLQRPSLEKLVLQFLDNRIHVVLIGPRRFGKTSFVLNLLKKISEENYSYIFVDIFNITSHRDFLLQMMRAFKAKKGWKTSLKQLLVNLQSLRPIVSVDFDALHGQQSFGFSLEKFTDRDVKDAIQEILSGIQKLGKKVIFVIDEFQKITEIDDNGWLEATLRTHMQQLPNTSFLFTGSRRSLIYDMLNNSSRPLYRSCQSIEFPVFGEEFTDWVHKRFATIGVTCEPGAIAHLRALVQDTPNYVQMICFHLVAQGIGHVTNENVETTLETVVTQNAYAYQTLLNTLTLNQQRVLRLASSEEKQIFSKELLSRYEISSSPALSSALKALKSKGILDEEGTVKGKVIFDDPLFAYWLKTKNELISK